MTTSRWLFTLLLAAAVLPAGLAAQERGTVTGTVVDQMTQQPLVGAQVTVGGTQLGTITNQQGRFLIANVPAGVREVRSTLIGYAQATQQVTVVAGESVAANLQMRQSAVALEGVVVTATGETQRVRERGNVVSQIPVAELDMAPITKMSEVLQGRTAGVVVQQSAGTSGTGARIRIRGSASASLSNQPLIIIDGIRVNDSPESFSLGVGGQTPSRLEDISPDEIESIEILRGPAAAALYGTAAATGVIQVTTRRGRAGATRWNVFTEQGLLQERNEWPGNYLQLGRRLTGTPAQIGTEIPCWTFRAATGLCEPTELLSWNPLMDRPTNRGGFGVSDPELGPASPFRDGHRQKWGVNASGGVDLMTYFLAGEVEREAGIYDNNNLDRVSLRANLRSQLRDDLDITLTSGWITSDLQLPWNDNTSGGFISDAITGDPEDNPETRGYSLTSPAQMALVDSRQGLRRLTGSVNSNYRPLPWLSVVGTAGLDVVNRHDAQTVPPATIPLGSLPEGTRSSNRIEVQNYTATLGATATTPLTPAITSTTSAGVQYHQEIFRGSYATGWQLLAGTGSLAGTNARFAVNEVNQDVRMVGTYVQQQFGIWDRLFVTAALRGDDNSAFGTDFGLIWYPALSASWVVSEEPWFPQVGVLNSVRLRSAVGRSGLRPGFRQAITFFSPVAATVQGRDFPAFTVGGVGDPVLRPEISTEFETGFDLGLLQDRLGLEFTYYNKRSEDALIARRLAPSLGMTTTRFENVGVVRNTGVEALLNANILNIPAARWNATLSIGTNRNRLVEMLDADGNVADPIIFGLASGQQHRQGWPLGGYWMFPITWEDSGGQGLLTLGDVEVGDTLEFAGQPIPTRNISFNSDVTLFNFLRLSGQVEHQGGHTLWAGNEEWQCVFLLCRALNDPSTPLDRQARGIGTWAYFTWWGYLEDASFTKLRELSATLMAPRHWNRRLGVDGLSLTLSGRNLATWTGFTGIDPEVNFAGQANFSTAEFQSQPPIRHWVARVNLNF
jgi:TonB-dependent starch-binding outer membrane protein SusC